MPALQNNEIEAWISRERPSIKSNDFLPLLGTIHLLRTRTIFSRQAFGRLIAFVSWLIATGCLASPLLYGSAHAAEATAALAEPVTVPLIKLEYPGNPPNIRMVYVQLLALGEHKIDQPLLFDTGSAGITVDCLVVLPSELCSENSIKIKKDLELDGMTITTQRAVSRYGTYDEYGNIALAQVKFGSGQKPVSTAERIPVLIRYKRVKRATGEIVGGYLWPKGTFGVSPVGGQAKGKLKSPMASVSVGAGLHRGYYLSPIGVGWKACTNEQRDCPWVYALHIGIDTKSRSDFKMGKWTRSSSNHNFVTEKMCLKWQGRSICRPTLYDTGNSTIQVAAKAPKGTGSALPAGMEVSVDGPAHEQWTFTTQYHPEVEFVPHIDHHIVGIRYFEENSLLVDLDTEEIGYRIGR